MTQTSSYQPHIDGLRAIAVISVLLFHLDIPVFAGGFVGVDMFFVLSGFLITRIIIVELETTNQFSFKNFYMRRVRRLLPAFTVVLVTTFFIASLLLSPYLMKSFGGSAVAALLSVSNILFWLEADYFDVSSHLKPLLHTWSLSIEEQFYMFWPITLLLCFKWRLRRWIPVLILLLFIISLAANLVFVDGHVHLLTHFFPSTETLIQDGRSTIFYLLPFRVFEFACGAILVFLPTIERWNKIVADCLSVIGIALIAYAIFSFDGRTIFPSFNALYPCVGTALLILAGAKSRISILLEYTWVTWIGLISYSLYLVHWPIIVFIKYFKINIPLNPIEQVFIIFTSIGLAYASYRWVETPFRRRAISPSIFRKPKVVLIGLTFIAALGLSAYIQNGWTWRVPAAANYIITEGAEQFHLENYGGTGFPRKGPLAKNPKPEILLIGDSHSRQYLYGLNEQIYVKHDINILVNAGTSCLHLPGFTKINADQNYDISCPIAYNRIEYFLSSNPNLKLVIIGQRWADQLLHAGLIDEHGQRIEDSASIHDVLTGLMSLKKLVSPLPLLIIGQVPETNNIILNDSPLA
jgi:prepilin-type processing-associated H-X9-DG protein